MLRPISAHFADGIASEKSDLRPRQTGGAELGVNVGAKVVSMPSLAWLPKPIWSDRPANSGEMIVVENCRMVR